MTAPARPARGPRNGDQGAASAAVVIVVAAVALLILMPLLFTSAASVLSTASCSQSAAQPAPAPAASAIPANYLALYQQAGSTYGIPWTILAAIGEVESGHGANNGPSTAGALGPMQFLPSTWAIYGQGGNIWNPADAIPAAARLLVASGARTSMPAAIFAYNHSADYVATVLKWASTYAAGGYTITAAQQTGTACTIAIVSQAPSKIAAQIIAFALAQIGKPYQWGATGPDAFDCSGLIYAAYRSVGITLPRTTFGLWPLQPHIPKGQEQPGDLVFFNTGPGSTPSHPGHVGLVIGGGQMVIANCPTCGPITTMAYQDTPALVGFVRPLADPALTGNLPGG